MEQTLERAGNFLDRVDEGPSSRVQNEVDRRIVSLTAPASLAAEQFRNLYFRLERLRDLRPLRVIALTSSLPGEGKTLTAVNLAMVSARADLDKQVLLIDTDLRGGKVSSVLGIRGVPGLCELLMGECESADVVRRFMSTRLAVIPAGKPAEDPAALLASARMKHVLKRIRDSFDEIYLDLPPVLSFADAGILAAQSDAIVMVIRANATSSRHVTQAVEQLGGAPVIGCVLNGAEPLKAAYVRNYMK